MRAFALDSAAAEALPGGRVSQVWRAMRDGEAVALRQSPWFRTIDEVAYECEVLRALDANGAPIAAPITDPILIDGATWTAFRWIDGEHRDRTSAAADAYRLGELLGGLHAATAPMVSGRGQRPRWRRMDEFFTLPRGRSGSAATTLADNIVAFERAHGASGTRLRRIAEGVHERLLDADVARLPMVIAHGDFGPHQVLVDGGAVSAVVDWDFCHLDVAIADVAIGTSFTRPDSQRAAQFLRGYEAASGIEVDPALLGDLRRAFHLTNLANNVGALWVNGIDITTAVATILDRLERDQWWGPLLSTAKRRAPAVAAESDLDVAQQLADDGAVIAMHYFTSGVLADDKADGSPVTDADRAVERYLRERLAELRPDDAILGEEFGSSGTRARTWILDPIDGTVSFAAGEANWRIQIALESEGETVLALVDDPALGRRWWATAGGGTFERRGDEEPRRLGVSTTAVVHDAVIAVYPPAIVERLPAHRPMEPRSPLPLVETVRGEIDAFYVECCEVWDHAPWILLVREAGGAFTDHEGGASAYKRGGLYSNGAVHAALLSAIATARAERA